MDVSVITANIKEMCIEANHFLTEDMKCALSGAKETEKSPLGKQILEQLQENMKKAKLDLSEFMLMCRQAGYFNLCDIQTAVYEYDGRLSILPVSTARPATPSDLNLSPTQETLFTEVIMDGRILDENLKRMGLNIRWLQKRLKEQGYQSADEVFLGICGKDHALTLFRGE